jgi:hypothetical protein
MELLTKVGLTKLAGAKHCCHSVGDEEQKFSNIGVRDGFNKKRNRRISDDSCVSLRLLPSILKSSNLSQYFYQDGEQSRSSWISS